MSIIVVRAQGSTRQRLRDYIFLPHSYVFVLKLRESLLKIVKSILRCRKTINSRENSHG